MEPKPSFLVRHEFLLRRLHSLTGLVPVGAYMVIHLLTNASIWNGPATFQAAVHQIHSLGLLLPVIEWTFIFIPILFHGIYGLIILRESQPNPGAYPYLGNIRYTLQRATGLIAFLFIGWHVFHMHGWIHSEAWREFIHPWGGQFAPFNAASSATRAMQQSFWVQFIYLIGVVACVFHLANGLWTMGITWGLWISPEAQRRADWIALAIGVLILAVAVGAWSGFALRYDASKPEVLRTMQETEMRMLERRVQEGLISREEAERKRDRHVNPSVIQVEVESGPGARVQPPVHSSSAQAR